MLLLRYSPCPVETATISSNVTGANLLRPEVMLRDYLQLFSITVRYVRG